MADARRPSLAVIRPLRPSHAAARGATASLLALAALSACGSSSGVNRAAYAHRVCTSIAAFETTLAGQAHALEVTAANAGDDPAALKADVAVLLAATQRASTALTDRLTAAGRPQGSGGKALAATLADVSRSAQQTYAAQPAALRNVPLTEIDTFTAALDAISASLRQGGDQLEAGLNTVVGLGDRKTADAFRADTTCRSL